MGGGRAVGSGGVLKKERQKELIKYEQKDVSTYRNIERTEKRVFRHRLNATTRGRQNEREIRKHNNTAGRKRVRNFELTTNSRNEGTDKEKKEPKTEIATERNNKTTITYS